MNLAALIVSALLALQAAANGGSAQSAVPAIAPAAHAAVPTPAPTPTPAGPTPYDVIGGGGPT